MKTGCFTTLGAAALLTSLVTPSLAAAAAASNIVSSTIKLDYVTLNGYVNGQNNVTTFLGVPYAEPPTGKYRFKAAGSTKTDRGSLSNYDYAKNCIPTVDATVGVNSEDCLYGNIWVPPNTKASDKLPVLMYFHGGGYQGGNTREFSGDDLLKSSSEPLIFATFSYRLGQFGFLGGSKVHGDGDGNAALLDQREAMRWAQKYIGHFGGDKSRVTIWGQSAGAGSVMFQLTAKDGNSEGLFHRVIADSPASSSMPYYKSGDANALFEQVALLSGCHPSDKNVTNCLRDADADKLAYAGSQTLKSRLSSLYPFSPTLDGKFLTNRPVDAFANGNIAKVPVLIGSNSNDGFGWSTGVQQPEANTGSPNSSETNVYKFFRGQYPYLSTETFDSIVSHYKLSDYNDSYPRQAQQMYGEVRYACTAIMIAQGIAKQGVDAYHYRFDNTAASGSANHGAELKGMFRVGQFDTQDETDMFSQMRQYWTSFATSGTPSASGGTEWKKTSSDNNWSRLLLHQGAVAMEEVASELSERCDAWHGASDELLT